jgi:hypothetical protein
MRFRWNDFDRSMQIDARNTMSYRFKAAWLPALALLVSQTLWAQAIAPKDSGNHAAHRTK